MSLQNAIASLWSHPLPKTKSTRFRRRSRAFHRLAFLKASFEQLESRYCLSVFYDFDIIAQTGQDGLISIANSASISDSGTVAFVAGNSLGQSVYVNSGAGPAIISSSSPSSIVTFGSEIQINNTDQVAAVDNVSGASPNPQRRARTWDASNPGSNTIYARSSVPPINSTFFNSLGNFPSITDNGNLVFAGLVGSNWEIHLANSLTSPGSTGRIATFPATTFFRTIAAAGGDVVMGSRAGTLKKVQFYDPAGGLSDIAITGSTWSDLGVRPGISDDGRIVTFYGDLTASGATALTNANGVAVPVPLTPGKGIFASVALGGSRYVVRIAGQKASGFIDPGERRLLNGAEAGPDFNFDGLSDWGIKSFDPDSRPSVATDSSGDFATVTFIATDDKDDSTGVGEAIFASRLNLFPNAIGVEAYVRVARADEIVVGNSGTATDLAVHDSINESGQVAFWASNGSNQAIVRASPKATTDHPYYFVNGQTRFMLDSPLVQYVVPAKAHFPRVNGRADINQVVMHATNSGIGTVNTIKVDSSVSPHYLVSQEGAVVQFVLEEEWAQHATNVQAPKPFSGTKAPGTTKPIEQNLTNLHSIGIEHVDGGPESVSPAKGHLHDPNWFTEEQARMSALLVRDITKRNTLPQEHLLPFPYGTTRDAERNWQSEPYVNPPNVSPIGPPVSTDPTGFNIVKFGQTDARTSYREGTPVQSEKPAFRLAADGFDYTARGIITHGQVLDRTMGKRDAHTRYFDGGWQNFMTRVRKTFGGAIYSPANLFIVDPLGRRLGVDPATGLTVNEIPGAVFSGEGTEPQTFAIPDPLDGDYDVRVVGTGSGNFRLELFSGDAAGAAYSTEVSGVTSLGQTNEYSFTNLTLGVESARVTSTTNLVPVTKPDIVFAAESVPVVIDTLSNDNDPDGTIDPSQVSILVPAVHGSLSVDPVTGMITYAPQPGFVGDDEFVYTVKDNAGASAVGATVSVSVAPNTTPPQAGDDSASTAVGTPVTILILANDSDPDGSIDPTTVEIVGPPAFGSLSVDPLTGAITYTPDFGFTGTDEFQYLVKDNLGVPIQSEATVMIIVQEVVNHPPVAVVDSGVGFTTDENTAFMTGNVLANDTDPDPSDTLFVQSINTASTLGLVTNNGDGTFGYDPNGQFEALAVGSTASDSFAYSISDGHGGTSTATVTLTIRGQNDEPVAIADSKAVNEDGPAVSVPLTGNDTDVDLGDELQVSSLNLAGTIGLVTLNSDLRSVTYNPNGQFESLRAGATGFDTFSYTVSDGHGGLSTTSVSVTILGQNDMPHVTLNGSEFTGSEGQSFSLTISANDPDQVDALSFSLDSPPGGAMIDPATGLFTWIPSDGPATVYVTVRVTDNGLPPLSDTRTFTIIVGNLPPAASLSGPAAGVNGQSQVFLVSATDPSLDDQAAGFAYSIDWGDGSTSSAPQAAGNGAGVPLTHVYSTMGHFVVRTTATDKDGGTSAALERAIDIVQVVAIDGNVYVAGTNGNDYIEVTVGAPLATIRFGNTLLRNLPLGPSGSIYVFALQGNDTVNGSRGQRMVIFGGDGNDVLTGGGGSDLIVGGLGNDRINGSAAGGNDEIWGDDYNPVTDDPAVASQTTLGGNDMINTFGGNDTVYGQGGNDGIYTGAGDDYVNGGIGNDQVDGQGGNDRIYGGEGNDTLGGSDGNDLIAGNGGNDTLLGRTGNDILIGGFGQDIVNGHEGSDALVGDESNGSGSGSLSKGDAADAALLALLLAWNAPGPPTLAKLGAFASSGNDGSIDTLWGGGDADAFFGAPLDNAADRNAFGYGPDLN